MMMMCRSHHHHGETIMKSPHRTPAEWAILMGEWRQSGLTMAEFCSCRGINLKTMQGRIYKRKHRQTLEEANNLQKKTPVEPTKTKTITELQPPLKSTFIPIQLTERSTPSKPLTSHSAIEIVLDGGRRIAVRAGFDEETLRRVVAALEARPC
jgi:hypothetical protein